MAYTSATQGPMPDEYMSGMDTNSFFSETQNPGLSSTISQSGTEFDISSDAMQTRKDQKVEMQSILDIFQLDEDLPDGKGGSELEANGDQSVDREDEKRRTERLRGICPALDRIWWTSSEYIIEAAERLADGSRDRKSASRSLLSIDQMDMSEFIRLHKKIAVFLLFMIVGMSSSIVPCRVPEC